MKKKKERKRRYSNQPNNEKFAKAEYESTIRIPKSIVIHHGLIGSNIHCLISDVKRVMKPNTAEKLVASRRNSMNDFVTMAGPLGVTHMMVFSQTNIGLYFKISRLPQGPTITFRVENYCLTKDILSMQTKQMSQNKHDRCAPCLMTNLLPTEENKHLQLCSKLFLDMFPTISPATVKANSIKRCCLIHYDTENDLFDFRHYAIRLKPLGICKATRKLISNKVPNLGAYKDVADYVIKSELMSDSEMEEGPSSQVTADRLRKGRITKQTSSAKLYEIGPRLTLTLVKIEDGVWKGAVLYHKFITRTPEELLEIQAKTAKKRREKRKRQQEQEANIHLKQQKKEEHRRRCLKGMGIDSTSQKRSETDAEDDAQYYKEEVGEDPEKDLFAKKPRKDKGDYKRLSKKRLKN